MENKKHDWNKPEVRKLLTDYCKKNKNAPRNPDLLVAAISKEFNTPVQKSIVYKHLRKMKEKLIESPTTDHPVNVLRNIQKSAEEILNSIQMYSHGIRKVQLLKPIGTTELENETNIVESGYGFDRVELGNRFDRVESEYGFDRVESGNGFDRVESGNGFDRIESGNRTEVEIEEISKKKFLNKDNYIIIKDFEVDLNSRLKSTIITVHSNIGYHQYSRLNKKDGIGEQYYCYECSRSNGIFGILHNTIFYMKKNKVHTCSPLSQKAWQEGKDEARQIGISTIVPNLFEINRSLRRWKAKNNQHIEPGNISEEFHFYPVNFYGVRERWILLDTDEVTIFCSDVGLEALATARILCADGTFKTCPHPYYQVFFIHAFLGNNDEDGEWTTALMALMKGKEQRQYDIVVDTIVDSWEMLDLEPKFERIHADYEAGLQNSLERLNGSDKVFGCLFHYSQNILHEVGQLGIRCLMALPLLPKQHIRIIWKTYLDKKLEAPAGQDDWPVEKIQLHLM